MEQDFGQLSHSHQEDKAILSLLQFQEISAENDNWQHNSQKMNKKKANKNSYLFFDNNKKNPQHQHQENESFLDKVNKYRDNAILMKNYLTRFKRANSLLEAGERFRKTYHANEPKTPKIFPQTQRIFQQHQKNEILHGEDQRKKQMHFSNGHPSRKSNRSNQKSFEKSVQLQINQKHINTNTNGECILLKVQSYQQTLNKREKQYWKHLNTQTNNFYPKLSQKKQFLFQNSKYSHFYEQKNNNTNHTNNTNKHLLNQLNQHPFFNKSVLQNDQLINFHKNKITNNSLDLKNNLNSPHNNNKEQMSISIRYLLNSLNSSKKTNSKEIHNKKQLFSHTQRKFNFHVNKPMQFDKDKLIKMYDSKHTTNLDHALDTPKFNNNIESKVNKIKQQKKQNQKINASPRNKNQRLKFIKNQKINQINKNIVNPTKNEIILVQEVSIREDRKNQPKPIAKKQRPKLSISPTNKGQKKQVYNQNFRVIKL